MGVPLAVDFATSPENRKIMELVYSSETFGRPYMMAPGVPADRVAALRKAFMETMQDGELLAEAQRIGLAIDPISGADLQELAAKIFATPRRSSKRPRTRWSTGRRKRASQRSRVRRSTARSQTLSRSSSNTSCRIDRRGVPGVLRKLAFELPRPPAGIAEDQQEFLRAGLGGDVAEDVRVRRHARGRR